MKRLKIDMDRNSGPQKTEVMKWSKKDTVSDIDVTDAIVNQFYDVQFQWLSKCVLAISMFAKFFHAFFSVAKFMFSVEVLLSKDRDVFALT